VLFSVPIFGRTNYMEAALLFDIPVELQLTVLSFLRRLPNLLQAAAISKCTINFFHSNPLSLYLDFHQLIIAELPHLVSDISFHK